MCEPILCLTNFRRSASACTSCWRIHEIRSCCFSKTIAACIARKLTGKKWTDITRGLPSRFGFGLAVPAAEPETLFTVPLQGAEYRCNLNGALSVARSRDGGKTWKHLKRGLPQKNAHVTVLREAMTADAHPSAGVYFGTEGGTIFATRDAGETWYVLAENLPPVYSISAA